MMAGQQRWIGAWGAAVLIAWVAIGLSRNLEAVQTMAHYRGTAAELPIRFDYPDGWETEVSRGSTERYTQVQVYAPKELEARLRCYLVVRRVEAEGDPAALAATYRKTMQPGWQVEAQAEDTVLAQPAVRLRVSGVLRLPWKGAHPQPIPVEGERLFVRTPQGLFELGWLATPTAAPTVSAAFAQLVTTLALD